MGILSSLGFGAPLLGLLGLPFLVGLVALYTIRSQPKIRTLPSLRLWQVVLRKKRPNSFLSRYRNSLFFLLQLLALLLAAGALMRPFLRSDSTGDILLVVDTSASMRTADGRFDAALEKARDLLAGFSDSSRTLVVSAGTEVRPRGSFTRDRGAARAALDALRTEAGSSVGGAELLTTLGALATDETRVVHLVTDSYRPEDLAGGLPGARVIFHHVGETRDNVALTRLDVRPQGTAYQVAALIRNYGARLVEVEVDLHAAGEPRSERAKVPPLGRERLVLFKDAQPRDGLLGARVRVVRGPSDRLDLDDAAYSAPRRGAVKVLSISRDGRPLTRALELNPSVAVERIAPDAFEARREGLEEYDLLVGEGFYHRDLEVRRALLFHGDQVSPVSTGRAVDDPEMTALDPTHPLTRYLDLGEVRFRRMYLLDKLSGGRPVLSAAAGPLIVALERPEARQVLCAFTLADTDLDRRIAFPIFLTNAVRWLLANDSKLQGHFRVGQPIQLRGDRPVEITAPDGSRRELPAVAETMQVLSPFEEIGVYHVKRGPDLPLPYPVNLLDPAESDIQPAGSGIEELGGEGADTGGGAGAEPLWQELAGLCLLVFFLEWMLLALRGGAS